MAYSHKTQSFMKNGGRKKCLDKRGKALITWLWSDFFCFRIDTNIKMILARQKMLVVLKQVFNILSTKLAKLKRVYNL